MWHFDLRIRIHNFWKCWIGIDIKYYGLTVIHAHADSERLLLAGQEHVRAEGVQGDATQDIRQHGLQPHV
jgi:hypothetical protein